MNSLKIKSGLTTALIALMLLPQICSAARYSFGSIDIRLTDQQEEIKLQGIPGQSFTKTLVITNFSSKTSDLALYVTDAEIKNNQLAPVTGSTYQDASSWIELDNENLSLQAGESKKIPVSITYPDHAGVGTHYAGIMVSQKFSDTEGNRYSFDSGIKVFAEVSGSPDSRYKIINPRVSEQNDLINYTATLVNSGNTDLKGRIALSNQTSDYEDSLSPKLFLKPGEDQKISLSTPKNQFGAERVVSSFNLGDNTKTFVLSEKFIIPGYLWYLFGILALTLITLNFLKNKTLSGSKTREAVKNSVFLLLLVTAVSIVLNFNRYGNFNLYANSLDNNSGSSYLTTVKWGNLTHTSLPDWVKTNWEGYIKLSSGQMFIVEKLHNENNDQISLNSSGNILNFHNTTGPDNDGVILLIKTDSNDPDPKLTVHNVLTGEEIPIPLSGNINNPRLINYKQHQLQIESEPAPELIQLKTDSGNSSVPLKDFGKIFEPTALIIEVQSSPDLSSLITDQEASPNLDLVLTPENPPSLLEQTIQKDLEQQKQLNEEIDLLKDLIQDIPASPDVISEYILNSDYVEELTSENQTATIKSSPALIDTLKDAPLTIQELTSTPDLNFIFLPNEKIKLSPQNFSFSDRKISSQELNEIVFVQRKNTPWTAYFSITNFVSVSGNAAIPADNVSIVPGKISITNQSGNIPQLLVGKEKQLTGINDLATLVSITPQGEGETTFSMRPRINVNIPAKTPPGLYKATISIKVL
jgi:hypothetical protein